MNKWKLILLLTAIMAVCTAGACPDNCQQCDDSGSICFACGGDNQVNVFGGCHANTIDKCVIYGPSDQCFRCQPTYSLIDGKCQKSYTGCINEGGVNQCFECAFGMNLDGTKCKGVLNCAQFSGDSCKKCKTGYNLSNGICKDSSAGCSQTRPVDGTCTKCKSGYYMSGYVCFEQKLKNNRCYVLADKDKCAFCKGGYNDVDGKCLLNKEIPNSQSGSAGFSTGSSQSFSTSSSTFGSDNSFGSFDGSSVPAAPTIANCDVPDPAGQGCIVCVYGYYPKNNQCQLVSPLCDGHNVQTGECFACKNQLTLDKGKCIDKYCSNFVNNKCDACQTGYKINDGGVCKQYDVNCLNSQRGRCQQCKPEYYIDINGKCKQLPAFCATANMQTGACLECVKDYQILSVGAPCTKKIVIENCQVADTKNIGKCLICVYGYFPDGNKCTKVSALCKDFNVQNGKCTSCVNPNFSLDDGKCNDPNCASRNGDVCTVCKTNFVYRDSDKICKLNDPNCKNLAIAACLQCNPGYYIGFDKICKALPANCASADQSGTCLTCVSGFELYRGDCIKTVVIPNCLVVDSPNNKCITCNNRFFLSGSSCAPVPGYCNEYSSNGKCTSCKQDMRLQQDGTCITPLPPAQPQPQVILPPMNNFQSIQNTAVNMNPINQNQVQTGVQTVIQTQDSSSQFSQTFNQGAQSTNINTVARTDGNCRQYMGSKCSKCSNRYYVGVQGRCVPVNPLCKDSNALGECTICYPGYKVDSGKCVIATSTDANCKTFVGQQCSACYQGYFYSQVDRVCKKVNPLCKTSNLNTGACTNCYPGYNLNQATGNCEVFFKDPNCKQFNADGSCRTCSTRYYINTNGKCSAANPLCKEYNQSNGACTACFPGYGLTSAGQCQAGVSQDPNCKSMLGSICKDCVSGFYLNPEGKCKQASPLCKTFDSKNGNCLTCYNGYEVSSGACVVAKSQDPNCKKVDNQNNCLICYSGYIAIRGKCLEQNPLCKAIDQNTGGCTSCWSGYSLIDSNCVLQSVTNPGSTDPYCVKMTNGVCIQCSSGYYFNKNQNVCIQSDPLCKTSDMNNGDCLSCYAGYYLNGNKCATIQAVQILNCMTVGPNGLCSECIEGTYLTNNNDCKQVSILCGSYNRSNGQCTSCVTGHVLQDGGCIFPGQQELNCLRYENAFCSKCKPGFYLNSSYNCNAIDQNCVSFNYATSTCEVCANNMYPNGNACM